MGPIITYDTITRLSGQRLGVTDLACPECGPLRRSGANQRRKVLRVWRDSATFITYRCARCDIHGFARDDGSRSLAPAELTKAKVEVQRFAAAAAEAKRAKARWLWGRRHPIAGTPAERYLR